MYELRHTILFRICKFIEILKWWYRTGYVLVNSTFNKLPSNLSSKAKWKVIVIFI